ncbi:hypothetical protein [Cupriavidus campinensis]
METTSGEPTYEEVKDWIKRRSDGFSNDFDAARDVSAKVGDEALRFLGLAHLGGIAGCLGFVGTLKQSSVVIGVALAVFILGVVCLMVAHLLRYLSVMQVARHISTQSHEFAANPTAAVSERLYHETKEWQKRRHDSPLSAALASAALFVVGSAAAAYAALTITPLPPVNVGITVPHEQRPPAAKLSGRRLRAGGGERVRQPST